MSTIKKTAEVDIGKSQNLFHMLFRYDLKTNAERLEQFLTPMVFAVATESRVAMCC